MSNNLEDFPERFEFIEKAYPNRFDTNISNLSIQEIKERYNNIINEIKNEINKDQKILNDEMENLIQLQDFIDKHMKEINDLKDNQSNKSEDIYDNISDLPIEYFQIRFSGIEARYPNRFDTNISTLTHQEIMDKYYHIITILKNDRYQFTYDDIRKVADLIISNGNEPVKSWKNKLMKIMPKPYADCLSISLDNSNNNNNNNNNNITIDRVNHEEMDNLRNYIAKIFIMVLNDDRTDPEISKDIRKNLFSFCMLDKMRSSQCCIL